MFMHVGSYWLETETHRSTRSFRMEHSFVVFENLMSFSPICSNTQSPLFAHPGIYIQQL